MDEHAEERSVLISALRPPIDQLRRQRDHPRRQPGRHGRLTGDIIVSRQGGVAHAGATGDEDAVVIVPAWNLLTKRASPRAPDGRAAPAVPEIAAQDDVIVIEEYP